MSGAGPFLKTYAIISMHDLYGLQLYLFTQRRNMQVDGR